MKDQKPPRKTLRQLAKEDPLWLSIVLVASTVVLTAINVALMVLHIKGIA